MNLSEYIHTKIFNHCFEQTNNKKILKYNNKVTPTTDLLEFSQEDLMNVLDDEIRILISKIKSKNEICYDVQMNCIIEIFNSLEISYNNDLIIEYIELVLELENNYPFDFISDGLKYLLLYSIRENLFDIDFWQNLYHFGNKNLKCTFGCAILKNQFDYDIYYELIQKYNFTYLCGIIEYCNVLSLEQVIELNRNLPKHLKNKIYSDCPEIKIKNVVLN